MRFVAFIVLLFATAGCSYTTDVAALTSTAPATQFRADQPPRDALADVALAADGKVGAIETLDYAQYRAVLVSRNYITGETLTTTVIRVEPDEGGSKVSVWANPPAPPFQAPTAETVKAEYQRRRSLSQSK